jgi:hypothetical protein
MGRAQVGVVEHVGAECRSLGALPNDHKERPRDQRLRRQDDAAHSGDVAVGRHRIEARVRVPSTDEGQAAEAAAPLLGPDALDTLDAADEFVGRRLGVRRRPDHLADPDDAGRVVTLAEQQAAGLVGRVDGAVVAADVAADL